MPRLLLVGCLIASAASAQAPKQPPAAAPSAAPAADPKGPPPPLPPPVAGTAPAHKYPKAILARGEYLTVVGGCGDCHTPVSFNAELGMPAPDSRRHLSGHPEGAPDPGGTLGPADIGLIGPTFTTFKLPFGVVYAPNLTPDNDTGMGRWTEEMFLKAMRTGRHLGGNGRPILPPMPWPALARMTDADLKALFAYLRSIPPIRNGVPSAKVPDEALEMLSKAVDKMVKTPKKH